MEVGLVFYSSLFFYSLTINNILNIIVLLILAGITINALTGSESAPAKANEAEQKNDIGSAKDQISLTAVNAKTEAYDTAYVGNWVSGSEAATKIGQAVIDAVLPYNGKTIGKASIEVEQLADRSAEITIKTRDFTEKGTITLNDGVLTWGESAAPVRTAEATSAKARALNAQIGATVIIQKIVAK